MYICIKYFINNDFKISKKKYRGFKKNSLKKYKRVFFLRCVSYKIILKKKKSIK